MEFLKFAILSLQSGLEGDVLGLGGGAGGVTPGIRNRGSGGDAVSDGISSLAFRRQREANSNVGTGTAYDWLSVLKIDDFIKLYIKNKKKVKK